MKYVYRLFVVFVLCTSCGQNNTNAPQETRSRPQARENSAGSRAVSLAATSRVPVSMVRHVKQARNGDILIASYLGVFRYDGTTFTNLTSKISPPQSSSFWDVLEDRKGNLWFGTRDSGIYRYNGKSFLHYTTRQGLAGNSALHIYQDRAGNIWFGASRYDGKSFRNLTTKDGFPSNNIRLLLEDKTGRLWFGAQQENLFVYDGKTFTVLKNKDGKAFNNVWSVIEDKKGNIWFGDAAGLWRYDGQTFIQVSQRGAYAIIEDKKGNIWTTGSNGSIGQFLKDSSGRAVWAVSRYDQKHLFDKKPVVTEIRSGSPAFFGLLEANDGSIWFGSGNGVHRYDGKSVRDFKHAAGKQ